MIDSIEPPVSPHERTAAEGSMPSFSKIPVALPSLTCSDTSSSPSMTDGPFDSSSSISGSSSSSEDLAINLTDPSSTKRPRQGGQRRRRRWVRFSELASVHTIENARTDWTPTEHEAVWYSQHDLHKQRRQAHQMAETMHFYTDDDLMDRFGLMSIRRQADRIKEVRRVSDCVLELCQDYGMTSWESVPVVVGVGGGWEDEEPLRLLQRYHLLTKLSERLALRRASKVSKGGL